MFFLLIFLLILAALCVGCGTTKPIDLGFGSVTVVDDINRVGGNHVWRSGNGYYARYQTPRNIYRAHRYYDERGGYETTTTTKTRRVYRSKDGDRRKEEFINRSRRFDDR